MGRIKNEIKDKVLEMYKSGDLENIIARELELSIASVKKIIYASGISQEADEEERSSAKDDEVDWEFWASFWKKKYLDSHAELVLMED